MSSLDLQDVGRAYVLCTFQTLVPIFQNEDDRGLEIGVLE